MKAQRVKKPSKLDALTASVAQDHAHMSSHDISRRRSVLTYEHGVMEDEIVSLTARLTDARTLRARIEATLAGLGRVLDRR